MSRKRPSAEELEARRKELRRRLRDGSITLGESVREMRRLTGLTQTEYAERVARVFPRVLMDIERGTSNPTLETLERIAKPWGWKIGFVPPPEEPLRGETEILGGLHDGRSGMAR